MAPLSCHSMRCQFRQPMIVRHVNGHGSAQSGRPPWQAFIRAKFGRMRQYDPARLAACEYREHPAVPG
jgi:hypothetical protein